MEASMIADPKNGFLVYLDKHFYTCKQSDEIYDVLTKDVIYDKDSKVIIFGKEINIPRKQTAYGDPGTSYKFSGVAVNAKPWLPILLEIKQDIEFMMNSQFNFCLVNYYENGEKYIGYHKDDEVDLGDEPTIASVSFGQTRKFYFKSDNSKLPVMKMELNHGCLCLMLHPTNTHWKHSVPKELKVTGPRINLTFRKITI